MSMTEFMQLQNIQDSEEKMSLLLAIHCAPILKGSKASNLLTVEQAEFAGIGRVLKGTNISYCFFKIKEHQAILFLYRRQELMAYLKDARIRAFLSRYGYTSYELNDLLLHLSERICLFRRNEISFPHEIGIFLEYPLEDVVGVLKNNGKNFKFAGYWKVYHDVSGAVKKFNRYDIEREHAVQAVISGKTISEIAVSLL